MFFLCYFTFRDKSLIRFDIFWMVACTKLNNLIAIDNSHGDFFKSDVDFIYHKRLRLFVVLFFNLHSYIRCYGMDYNEIQFSPLKNKNVSYFNLFNQIFSIIKNERSVLNRCYFICTFSSSDSNS